MPPQRMTANPVKPARYRPGKPVAEEHSSEDEYTTEEEEQIQTPQPSQANTRPKATSFPSEAAKIANNLRNVDLSERRRQAQAEEAVRLEAERLQREKEEEGFETAESQDEDEDSSADSDEDSGSGSEESSSEDEAPKKLLRPTFIKKDKRKDNNAAPNARNEDELWAEQEAERKAKANAVIQAQLDRDVAARAAGKKAWDDDEDVDAAEVDDTDNIDPEMERVAWKLRELKRVKRDREAIEEAEKEREEIERRRNLTKEEREAEDRAFLEQQKEDRDGKGKMGYMQKYFHKGAFFQDDAKAESLDRRDIMGSRYQDDVVNRELLPEYMQIRDMTRLGRKGRTKYKDLKSEDTGRWGQADSKGPRRDYTLDERFQPDRDGVRGQGPSGANSTAVGERRRAPENAPSGPRGSTAPSKIGAENGDLDEATGNGRNLSLDRERRRRSPPRRSRSRSGSPRPRKDRHQEPRRSFHSRSRSRSPPPRRKSYRDRRERSYSRSRSPSPRRDRYRDDRSRRKRSPSPHYDRYQTDKRQKISSR
ncbi:MAG: hypothetical protein L6R40_003437 [Gallowayella cf. fulva]|nr:MAG: hypothetical protein L6R40_003437 [Xanthomendoza cf. fulva]